MNLLYRIFCHSREGGNPSNSLMDPRGSTELTEVIREDDNMMDSRLRGNDTEDDTNCYIEQYPLSCHKAMRHLHLIAHNIRSRENVGSLFRTCDSLGVERLWLTGYTPTPPDSRISKVALGAETTVPFSQSLDIIETIRGLRAEGFSILALELTPTAQNIAEAMFPDRVALILGSEVEGVPPSILEQCDGAIKITQRGIKESMNVSVAAGIAAWAILR